MSSLRFKQKQLARVEILRATAELVTDRRQLDFSVQEVATRAGVSLRTVYNHFETRQDLLGALTDWVMQEMTRMGAPSVEELTGLDDIVDAVQRMFAINGQLGGLSDAYARLDVTEQLDSGRQHRTERFAELARADLPDLPAQTARNVGLLVRHLASQRSWYSLTRDYGMTSAEAGAYTAWAIRTVIDAARQGVTLPPPPAIGSAPADPAPDRKPEEEE
ncbi:MAG TPA: TetR/AcrR family transcriptional regulator [Euzebya sp.]|nr:TetR/AcrR family transcriptional regulator [Euzebya sp.]